MSTEQEPQILETREENRIRQIEADLHALNWQVTLIEDELHYVRERLKNADLYTSEMVLPDSIAPVLR